jgi:mannose-6-phosphate isomerase-like protein (cupin superfamily)
MHKPMSPLQLGAQLKEHWSPQVIAAFDEHYVKVAKIHGAFGWHSHADEDELFLIVRGSMRIELDSGTVTLNQGELYVVPKGTRHAPVADEECLILLIEKKTTLHAGDTVNPRARSVEEQLGG